MAEQNFFGESEEPQSESEQAQEAEFYGTRRGEASASERRSFRQLWLISYSDFMTILMIFFLGMYGYTVLAKAALQKEARMSYSDFSIKMGRLKKDLGDQVQMTEDSGKIVLQLPERILFSSGQAVLNEGAKRTLSEFSESLKQVDGEIVVEGHTDDVPVKAGRFASNWELSAARAFSVIEELDRDGVPADRLAAWGFGQNRPIAPNKDATSRAKNRRIEIVLLKTKSR